MWGYCIYISILHTVCTYICSHDNNSSLGRGVECEGGGGGSYVQSPGLTIPASLAL